MNTKYLFSGVIAAALLGTACTDELDVEKKGNLGDPSTYYTEGTEAETDAKAEAAIAMNYAQYNRIMPLMYADLDNLSDDIFTGGGSSGDYNDYQLINAYSFGSDNPNIKRDYQFLYTVIYNSNLVIEYVTKNEKMTPVKNQCIAEAYFFRGVAHMYLATLWGDAPVVNHVLAPSECAVANNTREEGFAQAISDLQQAVSMNALPKKGNKSDVVKRVSQHAALAYLGKAQLYAGKYADAAKSLGEVVNSNVYDLEPIENYENLHQNRTADGPEVVFARYLDPTSTLPMSDWSDPQGVNCYYDEHVMWSWRNDGFVWAPVYGNPASKFGDMEPGYAHGIPRANLYESMEKWEKENGAANCERLHASMISYADMVANGLVMDDKYVQFGCEGYWQWKRRFLTEEIIGYYGQGGWNVWINSQFRFMRYAEVLLMAAEAYLQSGNAGEAVKCLNVVRERAGETALGSCTMDQIKNEKRFELCMEAVRFIDLVRWGDAASVLKEQGKQVPSFNGTTGEIKRDAAVHSGAGFVEGKHNLLPIPATEILVNPNIKQNPGWTSAADGE